MTEVGKGVSKLRAGDKVAVQPTIYCGHCGACKVQAENACPNGGFVGLSGGGGGMSEFVVVPQEACFPLPSNVDLDIGALVEPLAVAWHAVDASPIASLKEPNCLVFGGGKNSLNEGNDLHETFADRSPRAYRSRRCTSPFGAGSEECMLAES